MKALFDTNILIDYLNGTEAARGEFSLYGERLISPISWMEVMIGTRSDDEQPVRAFLATFTQISMDQAVANEAVILRRETGIRLPDAIVWASARTAGALLVTRNVRDFPPADPGVRIPYEI